MASLAGLAYASKVLGEGNASWPDARKHHESMVYEDTERRELHCVCRCGWRLVVTEELARRLFTKQEVARFVVAPWEKHLEEEQSKLNPTLRELTEWGWFQEEAT